MGKLRLMKIGIVLAILMIIASITVIITNVTLLDSPAPKNPLPIGSLLLYILILVLAFASAGCALLSFLPLKGPNNSQNEDQIEGLPKNAVSSEKLCEIEERRLEIIHRRLDAEKEHMTYTLEAAQKLAYTFQMELDRQTKEKLLNSLIAQFIAQEEWYRDPSQSVHPASKEPVPEE